MNASAKPILITGCSTGIGWAAANILDARGYQVIASVRKEEDIEPLRQLGLDHVIQLDLNSSESIERGIEQTLSMSEGRIYALFNNAAYGLPGAVEDVGRDALRRQFETNVFGTHELTTKLLPYLLKEGSARIIQNSSILGFAAMPMRGAYNASKFALEGLSDTLRMELVGTGVKVSIIEPGPITSAFRKNCLLAFEREINAETSRHHFTYQAMLARLNKKGATSRVTLGPEAVVKKLIHALESERPKARYYVTLPTYLFAFLRHVLPTALLDRLLIEASR